MTETTPTRVNGHAAPKVKLIKFTDQPDADGIPTTPAVVEDKPQARRLSRAARRLHKAATHDRTRTILQATVRHTAYMWGGAGVVTKQVWEGRTVAVHHRMRAAALAAGDTAAA